MKPFHAQIISGMVCLLHKGTNRGLTLPAVQGIIRRFTLF
ncbi:DUF2575 domain-containing protein [Serratia marcescens]|nr:DUF2575 domain-containing protein [Serratia marcescens]QHJ24835.1 DUF2575 domain-containing protein [Serratia marcescens]